MVCQIIIMILTGAFKIKADWLFDFELQYALSKLATSPATSFIAKCSILGFAYIIIFNLIAYISLKNTEVK